MGKNAFEDWDISISCETEVTPRPCLSEAIGIDMGIKVFAILSIGDEIASPHFFKQGEKALAKEQKTSAKLEKGTPTQKKQGRIVENYQYICIKGLSTAKR